MINLANLLSFRKHIVSNVRLIVCKCVTMLSYLLWTSLSSVQEGACLVHEECSLGRTNLISLLFVLRFAFPFTFSVRILPLCCSLSCLARSIMLPH